MNVCFYSFFWTAYAGSKSPPSLHSLIHAMTGRTSSDKDTYMAPHERLDFIIITLVFGVLAGA